MNRPDFVDNRDGNTLASALRTLLGTGANEETKTSGAPPDQVRIATAFFSPSGFAQIANHLTPVKEVRLMLGADVAMVSFEDRKKLDETPKTFEHRRIRMGIDRMDTSIRRERDRLPFTRTSFSALRKLIDALEAGNMEVRRYEENFLHAKAYILTSEDSADTDAQGIIAGSSNLTNAGLTRNLELNLGRYEGPIVHQAREWFDELWEEATPYDLAGLFQVVFQLRNPWEIFIRVLLQLYGDEVDEDAKVDHDLPLTNFQRHGTARAMRLIRDYGGAIVADEVGLGKTFIAGEVLRHYRDNRQRALLICPASLRDTTWKQFLTQYQLFAECVSFNELANDKQLRNAQRPNADSEHLQRGLEEYQLIVVDEAHNYRNPDAPTRAAALRTLLFGRKRDLLLLTATPVNNSLWDLFHLIRFFIRQDAHLADRGILSIRQRFDMAAQVDPTNLSPDLLYPIIDATTVKRTRQFIKKHYAGDTITGPDGTPQPIVFPQPNAMTVRYNLDEALPGFFDNIEEALDPNSASQIKFSRYAIEDYLRPGIARSTRTNTNSVTGLLRSGLLKRFESSMFAFKKTIQKMTLQHELFLEGLERGHVVNTAFMQEISGDDDGLFEELFETAPRETHDEAKHYDVEALRTDVEHDRSILQALGDEVSKVSQDASPKLKALSDTLVEIATQAAEEATHGEDEAQRRKVVIFSFFEDTVEWIYEFLQSEIARRPELAPYQGRLAAVSGSGRLSEESRTRVVQGFAPISMGAPAGEDADRYDLLLATDVLAEGVNLQQCRNIINFDIPWNPMRLVQRHGRIDRIGSQHSRVFLRTIFPVDRLDQLLNLEQRILDKLALAAAAVGVVAPIEGAAEGSQVFAETRDEIENLLNEDASIYERGGTTSAAQTGEEYRQTLRKELEQNRELLQNLPSKIGSGMIKGSHRGVFFCATVGDRTYLRFIPGNADWQPGGQEDTIVREQGTCLRLIECDPDTDLHCAKELEANVYDFWEIAQQDIWKDWMRQTDPANLQPEVRPLNRRVADYIRVNPPLGVAEDRLIRALDILESPWPRRDEIILRGWFAEDDKEGAALSGFLIEKILETGLEPFLAPPPLPPIELEEVELICWMGIEPEKIGNTA